MRTYSTDKICDQISDAIVTDCLKYDMKARVAVECLIKDYNIVIAGELSSNHNPDFKKLAKSVLKRIGLENIDNYKVTEMIIKQSSDIALGVDGPQGAGDQGVMVGMLQMRHRNICQSLLQWQLMH